MKKIRLIFCLVILGTSSYGSTFTPRGMYADEIAEELRHAAGSIRVNLKNKPLCFANEDRIFVEAEANKVLDKLPDSLQILDLSFNRLTEETLAGLVPLLLRDGFRYLDVTTNSGADSIEAIRGLVSALSSKGISGPEALLPYLSMIIWVREEHLKSAEDRGILTPALLAAHGQYYEMKKELGGYGAAGFWESIGIAGK